MSQKFCVGPPELDMKPVAKEIHAHYNSVIHAFFFVFL